MTIDQIYRGNLAALYEQKYRYECYITAIESQIERIKVEAKEKGIEIAA